MAGLGNLVARVGADMSNWNRSMSKVKRDVNGMTSNMQAAGRSMTMAFTAPIAYLAGTGIKTFANFEQSMAKVKAVSGATGSEFKALEQNAKDLGSSTRFTASQVADLQLQYAKLGFSSEEINQVTKATLNLAQATDSDLAQAAEVAGSTIRAFGMDATETGKLTDVMATAFSGSALDLTRFQESMKMVAPVAKSAGMSAEDVTSRLMQLADAGIHGSQAGTALRRIIVELGSTGGDTAGSIKKLAENGITMGGAMDEVGRNAQAALLVLGEGADKVDGLTKSLENSEGAAAAMAKIMDETTTGSFKKMESAIEGAQIAIGEALAPTMVGLADNVASLAQGFTGLSSGAQGTIMVFGGLLAVAGPLLVVIPQMVMGYKMLGETMVKHVIPKMVRLNAVIMANPYAAAAALVIALGLAFYSMRDSADAATQAQEQMASAQQEATSTTARQMSEVDRLSLVVQDETKSEEGRLAALKSLNKIAPEYFGNINMETLKMGDLKDAVENYRDSILKTAKTKVFTRQLEESVAKMEELKVKMDEGPSTLKKYGGGLVTFWNAQERHIATVSKEMKATEMATDKLRDALFELEKPITPPISQLEQLRSQLDGASRSLRNLSEGTEAYDTTKTQIDELKASIDELTKKPIILDEDLDETDKKAKELNTTMTNLEMTMQSISGVKLAPDFSIPTDGKFEAISSGADEEFDEYNMTGGASDEEFTAINTHLDLVADKLERNSQLAGAFGGAMGASLGSIISGGQAADQALKNMGMSMLRTLLGIAKAHVVAAMSAPSTDVVATGGATIPFKIAAGFGLVEGLLGAIAFADGGIVSGPTLGLVGEYSGAKNNPEVIAPLDKLKGMIQETNTGGGGGVMTATIKGSDLVLVSERGAKDLNRKRG